MSDPWNVPPRPNKRSRPREGEEDNDDEREERTRTHQYGIPPGVPHPGPQMPHGAPPYYYPGPPPPGYPSQQPVPPPPQHHPPYMYHPPHHSHYHGYPPPPPPEYGPPRPQDPYYMPPPRPEYASATGYARGAISAAQSSSSVGSLGGDSGSYDVVNKRAKKNAQSRARAAKLRQKIEQLKYKPAPLRTDDEDKLFAQFEERRSKKNERSRERAIEKKAEVERILAIPEHERSREDQIALDTAIKAKLRKNEGDRLRRERIKRMGMKQGNQPRSRGRPKKQASSKDDVPSRPPSSIRTGVEHPISPIAPSVPSQELAMPSPNLFMSPGVMGMGPTLGFPSSPVGAVTAAAQLEGRLYGRHPVPLLPRDEDGDDSEHHDEESQQAGWPPVHFAQRPSAAQDRRRLPGGSMSINIFGRTEEEAGGAAHGARPLQGEGPPPLPPPDILLFGNEEKDEQKNNRASGQKKF